MPSHQKNHAGSRHRAATSLKRNRTAWVVARGKIKRLKSALVSENKGCIYGEKGKSRVVPLWSGIESVNGVGFNPIPSSRGSPMRTTQQFSITLPHEMADVVKRKVGVVSPNRRNLSSPDYSQSIPAKMASRSIGCRMSRKA
jgi:hypothetical protein